MACHHTNGNTLPAHPYTQPELRRILQSEGKGHGTLHGKRLTSSMRAVNETFYRVTLPDCTTCWIGL